MRLIVNPVQILDRHMRIDLSGGNVAVPQHLLDLPDVGAMAKHFRSCRMPQQVARSLLINSRPVYALGDHIGNLVALHPLADLG